MALDLFIVADCGTADRVAANLTLLKWPGIVKFSHDFNRRIKLVYTYASEHLCLLFSCFLLLFFSF